MSSIDVNSEAAASDLRLSAEAVAPSIADRLRGFYELTKPNLSGLVMITGVLGAFLASPVLDARLFHLALGLWCTSGGAAALNMFIERESDARMRRTRARPLPSGRVSPAAALIFAIGIFTLGFVELALFTTWTTALLSLATLILYAFVYTPLKKSGPIAVPIGAIPGAIPPVMGWAAIDGSIGLPALFLFALLFLWQFPHFFALAWMYREDYQREGFIFLPKNERLTASVMISSAATLIFVTLALQPLGVAGPIFTIGAFAASVWFLARTKRIALTNKNARSVFFASIIYLPLLLVLIVTDRLILGA